MLRSITSFVLKCYANGKKSVYLQRKIKNNRHEKRTGTYIFRLRLKALAAQ